MHLSIHQTLRACLLAAGIVGLVGCTGLANLAHRHPPVEYRLAPAMPARISTIARCETLLVTPPDAAPGFDTNRMYYTRKPLRLDYYARHRWTDTPAHMLHPLLVEAAEHSGLFTAVIRQPAPATNSLRLDSQLLELEQVFAHGASSVHLRFRVTLFAPYAQRVVASHVFDLTQTAPNNNPYGDATATNEAVTRLLAEFGTFLRRHVNTCSSGRRHNRVTR